MAISDDYEETIRRLAAERRARDIAAAARSKRQRDAEAMRKLQEKRWSQTFENKCVPLIEVAAGKTQEAGRGVFQLSLVESRRSTEEWPSIVYFVQPVSADGATNIVAQPRGGLPDNTFSISFIKSNDGRMEICAADQPIFFVSLDQFDEKAAGKAFATLIERALGAVGPEE
jgi:hypothetical protein